MEIQGLNTLLGMYDSLVFFDVETTGFDPDSCQMIELAGIRASQSGTIDFDEFIELQAGHELPQKIEDLTGITPLHLVGAPSEEMAIGMFAEKMMVGKTLLVAHNAQFDLNFLGAAYVKHRKELPDLLKAFFEADYLDSLTVFRDRKPAPHKLLDAIKKYGLEGKVQNSHRAIDDTRALYEVVRKMAEERDDLHEYINIFGYDPRYEISGKTLKKVEYLAQGTSNFFLSSDKILPTRAKGGGKT
jgi:DNA polymerase-3 subunit epsilon